MVLTDSEWMAVHYAGGREKKGFGEQGKHLMDLQQIFKGMGGCFW